MRFDRELGHGVLESQLRAVAARAHGLSDIAARLGVEPAQAREWLVSLGTGPRPPAHQVMTAQDVLAAILSTNSLHHYAHEAGVSPAALHTRARRTGLPTDPAGRAALRAQRMAS